MKSSSGFKISMTTVALAMAICAMGAAGCRSNRGQTGHGAASGTLPPAFGANRAGEIEMRGNPFEGPGQRGEFAPVYFEYDSATVLPVERPKIEVVAARLRASPNVRLAVEGHCDERGSAEYNLALGERRALEVRTCLLALGVEADRMQTRSFGEEQPAEVGHSEDAWKLNRRGEFVVFGAD